MEAATSPRPGPLIPGRNSSKSTTPFAPAPSPTLTASPVVTMKEMRGHFASGDRRGRGEALADKGEGSWQNDVPSRSSSKTSLQSFHLAGAGAIVSPHSPTPSPNSLVSPAVPDSSKITDWIDMVGRMRGTAAQASSPLAASHTQITNKENSLVSKTSVSSTSSSNSDTKMADSSPVPPPRRKGASVPSKAPPSSSSSPATPAFAYPSSATTPITPTKVPIPIKPRKTSVEKIITSPQPKSQPTSTSGASSSSSQPPATPLRPRVLQFPQAETYGDYKVRSASLDEMNPPTTPTRSSSAESLPRLGGGKSLPSNRHRYNTINPRGNSASNPSQPSPLTPSLTQKKPPVAPSPVVLVAPSSSSIVIATAPVIASPLSSPGNSPPPITSRTRGLFGTILGLARGAGSKAAASLAVATTLTRSASAPMDLDPPASPKRTRSELSDEDEYPIPGPGMLAVQENAIVYPKTLSRSRNKGSGDGGAEDRGLRLLPAGVKAARFALNPAVFVDDEADGAVRHDAEAFRLRVPMKPALKEHQRRRVQASVEEMERDSQLERKHKGERGVAEEIDDEIVVKGYLDKETAVTIMVSRRNTSLDEVVETLEKKLAKVLGRNDGIIVGMRTRDKDEEWVEFDPTEEIDWRIRVSECFEDKMVVYLTMDF
ncbi:hypothetical protein BC830DRAFT_1168279 [Chytriomyces sp. MP71]|nr:hypothetical protein BC830DRAFT_1168279 [Chytriomyces sp. MP71]